MHDQNSTVDYAALKEKIREAGQGTRLFSVGVARADPGPAVEKMREWLAAGCHGEMDYMARHAELRADPSQLHPGTITVISAALDYLPHTEVMDQPEQAAISRYAQGRDYHKVIRNRLRETGGSHRRNHWPFRLPRSFPTRRRSWKSNSPAGRPWLARKTHAVTVQARLMAFSRRHLLLTCHCLPTEPIEEHCGNCTACMDACPTQAIIAPTRSMPDAAFPI